MEKDQGGPAGRGDRLCACPYCEHMEEKPFPFCEACGKEVKYCPSCQRALAKEAKACGFCGYRY